MKTKFVGQLAFYLPNTTNIALQRLVFFLLVNPIYSSIDQFMSQLNGEKYLSNFSRFSWLRFNSHLKFILYFLIKAEWTCILIYLFLCLNKFHENNQAESSNKSTLRISQGWDIQKYKNNMFFPKVKESLHHRSYFFLKSLICQWKTKFETLQKSP